MPSKSKAQANFMRAVAHSPKFAKKVGVPQNVGRDFEAADKKKSVMPRMAGTKPPAKKDSHLRRYALSVSKRLK